MSVRYKTLQLIFAVFTMTWTTSILAFDYDAIYFAQHAFYADHGKHLTTNYHKGTLIPVNTRVKITHLSSSRMNVELLDQGNTEIHIVNMQKHTKKSMREIQPRMFNTTEVNLSRFSAENQDGIKNGKITVGMTKDEIIMAYGYPPAHATPSTGANQWTYWKTRHNRIVLNFHDDKLTSVRD